jgi:hypothetical protein
VRAELAVREHDVEQLGQRHGGIAGLVRARAHRSHQLGTVARSDRRLVGEPGHVRDQPVDHVVAEPAQIVGRQAQRRRLRTGRAQRRPS